VLCCSVHSTLYGTIPGTLSDRTGNHGHENLLMAETKEILCQNLVLPASLYLSLGSELGSRDESESRGITSHIVAQLKDQVQEIIFVTKTSLLKKSAKQWKHDQLQRCSE
jgi:hypothetical protein